MLTLALALRKHSLWHGWAPNTTFLHSSHERMQPFHVRAIPVSSRCTLTITVLSVHILDRTTVFIEERVQFPTTGLDLSQAIDIRCGILDALINAEVVQVCTCSYEACTPGELYLQWLPQNGPSSHKFTKGTFNGNTI